MKNKLIIIAIIVVISSLMLSACGSEPASTNVSPTPTKPTIPTMAILPAATIAPTATISSQIELEKTLKQNIDVSGYDGITDLFFEDLQTGEKFDFAYQKGKVFSTNPDIAFSAGSTGNIFIMMTVFLKNNGKLDGATTSMVADMIQKSNAATADSLLMSLDEKRGPLIVTETMQKLGLENTFLGSFYHSSANGLKLFKTPANSRTDVSTDPDVYSQTTPTDMGMLLEDIYQCSQNGSGTIVVMFPGQIDRSACQQMIQTLAGDKLSILIQEGVPEGTVVAHKHSWSTDLNGNILQISDAGIVYTPGGNYILNIYTYHPIKINFDQDSGLYALLSRTVYNYFNSTTK
jgi:beta-lactamase class A